MKDTVEYLQYVAGQEGVTAESSALNAIAQKADGGMRDALSIFDQIVSSCGQNITYQGVVSNLNVLDYEFYFRLTEAILANDIVNALLILNDILSRGFDGNQFITGMSTHLRDLLVSKDAQTVQLLDVSTDIAEKYKTQAEKCPLEFLIQALKIANDCDLNYQLSRNKRLLVELTLIRLCQLTDEKKKTIIEDEPIAPLQKIVPANLPVNVPVTSPVSQSVVQPVTQQPAVSPQPQAATSPINQPAPPPAPAASSLRRPMGISIHSENAAANVADTSAPIAVPVAVSQQNEVFKEEPVTASDLEAAWVAFAATIPEEVRMVNFINENKPQLVSDNLFEVTVVNQLLMKELERLKPGLMSFLHARLNNITLQMSISITAEAATSRALSPEEHYRTWVEQNPALEKLRQGLNMEID
jgi:DNA polymerase-3 subunit gamma/tau